MKPYQNESDVQQIGDLTIENRTDRVSIHGSLDITRDLQGLASARDLKALLDAIVAQLESEKLPDKITVATPKTVKNPFK